MKLKSVRVQIDYNIWTKVGKELNDDCEYRKLEIYPKIPAFEFSNLRIFVKRVCKDKINET